MKGGASPISLMGGERERERDTDREGGMERGVVQPGTCMLVR